MFLVTYFDDIYWERVSNGEKISKALLKELEAIGVPIVDGSFDKQRALKALDFALASGSSKIHNRLDLLVNPSNKKTVTLSWFKTVQKLPAGASFGERALLKNEDRAATIVCSKDTTFATLHRRDYNAIIGAAQKKELKEKVDFLRGFRMFS